ncbi:shikimate kinase [Cytophagaceae bacterium 50C-KIRBA]|uniref:Shikimate kinase n=1 Tax=Aquirufa beregesia TaxID=2516556 RepID=A0ABX0EY50_9BACT|nr:shikimate kinase [Aquirufa beregesia]NGZ45394.1 shikimate kinase [Aquirufa beregesia]
MRNIYLIGMPSSGKSTLGKELAKNLGFSFTDMDKLIETREQKTISEIFSNQGEAHFRELERKTLHGFQPDQSMVIATGGGVPCFFDNMDYMKKHGISIFLNVELNDLAKRLYKAQGNNRPLLDKSQSEEAVIATIKKTFEERLPFYKQADIQVDGEISVNQLLWLIESYVPVQ